jgi:hypothetical protein
MRSCSYDSWISSADFPDGLDLPKRAIVWGSLLSAIHNCVFRFFTGLESGTSKGLLIPFLPFFLSALEGTRGLKGKRRLLTKFFNLLKLKYYGRKKKNFFYFSDLPFCNFVFDFF